MRNKNNNNNVFVVSSASRAQHSIALLCMVHDCFIGIIVESVAINTIAFSTKTSTCGGGPPTRSDLAGDIANLQQPRFLDVCFLVNYQNVAMAANEMNGLVGACCCWQFESMVSIAVSRNLVALRNEN